MPTQTSATFQGLAIPSGTEIYDALMGAINPELLTANLAHLDEQYQQETPEQKAERYKKYEADFAAYDAAYQKWSAELHRAVDAYRRVALKSAEKQTQEEEGKLLTDLETQFTSTPSL